ncbi:MAG: TlpA family protein disulfide reductase [Planctomycetes bacterium]|nr:TlpA family protein disulfide reductase [Planctomycetota bacterium]
MKKSTLSKSSAFAALVLCAGLTAVPFAMAQTMPSSTPSAPPAAPTTPPPTPPDAPAIPSDMPPPAGAPMDIPPEFKSPAPSTTWTAEEKSPESMKKAVETVHGLTAKYGALPAVEETMTIRSPQFQGQDQKVQLMASKGGDAKVVMPGITITRLKDQVYVEMDGRPKYAQIKAEGTAVKAIGDVMGGKLPLPSLILIGGDQSESASALTLGQCPDIVPTGFRAGKDGKPDQVLLVDPAGTEVVANLDPKSGLIDSLDLSLTNPQFPAGMRLPMTVSFERKVYDNGFTTPIAFDPAGRKMKDSLEAIDQAFDTGDDAPNFTLATTDGKTVSLADLKGKVVVLDFWATWCKPCMQGLPLLDTFAKWAAESGKPIVVYAVDVMERSDPSKPEERIKMVADFWKNKAFTVPTLVDVDDKAGKDFQLTGIPFTVVIGPDGKIAATHLGFDANAVENLKKDVEKALSTKG